VSLALIGTNASYEFRWRRWALLRDTVEAHVEGGKGGSKFPRFASIGDALVEPLRVPAKELLDEILQIREALKPHPISALMLGSATAAVLYVGSKLEAPRPLTQVELSQIIPVGGATNLDEYFTAMLDSIIHVCKNPAQDGTVEILDG